jgi:hypothetical protein
MGGGWWSQLLRNQSVGPPPRIGFDRFDQFHPGPGFGVLYFLLESASLLPVALIAVGDLFVASPLAPSPSESSSGQRAFSSEFRDLLCPPVGAAVACSAAGYRARHRGIAGCAHVPLQAFRRPLSMPPSCVARASQLHTDTVTAAWSRSLSLSFSRHLGVGGGRERLGPRVLLRSCLVDVVSEVSTIIMYRWSDSVSTSSATFQLRIRFQTPPCYARAR